MKKNDSHEGWKSNLTSDYGCAEPWWGPGHLSRAAPDGGMAPPGLIYIVQLRAGCHGPESEIKIINLIWGTAEYQAACWEL